MKLINEKENEEEICDGDELRGKIQKWCCVTPYHLREWCIVLKNAYNLFLQVALKKHGSYAFKKTYLAVHIIGLKNPRCNAWDCFQFSTKFSKWFKINSTLTFFCMQIWRLYSCTFFWCRYHALFHGPWNLQNITSGQWHFTCYGTNCI